MKIINKYFSVLALTLLVSCTDEFLERKPKDAALIEDGFNTPEQVESSVLPLYGFAWFEFNDRFMMSVGDGMSGNVIASGAHSLSYPYYQLSVQTTDPLLMQGWRTLFRVVANANMVIVNVPKYATHPSISPELKNRVVGEARFMRALAYFYLVRLWKEVPIIEDNFEAINSPLLPKNREEDIYKLIERDLKFAEIYCSPARQNGRVTKWTAKALMAKVYLTLKQYELAELKCREVLESNVYKLMDNYADLFKIDNNNNIESLLAFQWISCSGWGVQNVMQAFLAHGQGSLTEVGDGWEEFLPSIDLQNAYEDGDLRKPATIFVPGHFYPELKKKYGGYTYPKEYKEINSWTKSHVKKGVVGSPDDTDGKVCQMSTPLNTNVLRYSDVLLMYAEAIMAGASNTASTAAIDSVNQVRVRAGLPKIPNGEILTADQLLTERRIELAMEGEFWFDLLRINRAKAINIISNQERGFYNPEVLEVWSNKRVPPASAFLLPFPEAETDKNPKLLLAAEPYVFKDEVL